MSTRDGRTRAINKKVKIRAIIAKVYRTNGYIVYSPFVVVSLIFIMSAPILLKVFPHQYGVASPSISTCFL